MPKWSFNVKKVFKVPKLSVITSGYKTSKLQQLVSVTGRKQEEKHHLLNKDSPRPLPHSRHYLKGQIRSNKT